MVGWATGIFTLWDRLFRARPQRLPMKVYLDNNIVSAIAKDDEPAESDAP
jgi:hypothetical protein